MFDATDHGQQGGGVYLASRIFGRGVSTKRHKASQGVRGCKKMGKRHVFCEQPLISVRVHNYNYPKVGNFTQTNDT